MTFHPGQRVTLVNYLYDTKVTGALVADRPSRGRYGVHTVRTDTGVLYRNEGVLEAPTEQPEVSTD